MVRVLSALVFMMGAVSPSYGADFIITADILAEPAEDLASHIVYFNVIGDGLAEDTKTVSAMNNLGGYEFHSAYSYLPSPDLPAGSYEAQVQLSSVDTSANESPKSLPATIVFVLEEEVPIVPIPPTNLRMTCGLNPCEVVRGPVVPPSGLTDFIAEHSDKCIGIEDSSTDDGAFANQYTCTDAPNQQFNLVAVGTDTYKIMPSHNGHNDFCLEINNGSDVLGARLRQASCKDVSYQVFRLESATSYVIAMHSGRCLDVSSSSTQDGAKVFQFKCANTANQRWTWEGK